MNRRRFLGGAAMLCLHAACGGGSDDVPRCARCGMRVDTAPAWLAGHGDARFDGPKCLFRWAAENGRDAGEGWATEYFDTREVPLREAFFVAGSDVVSPMGDDLVPLRTRALAERFAGDHGGRVLAFGEVDDAVLQALR
ncbi:MAG: nitrous oxide reductase accessory protein NosL [Sandaracinus sp.]|nr:nitrous oxide reductase accessory protein NosL [Sandaracinus sp.]MCB9611191.1 nitrous oxide reductase accessory protein NosL [Sandaracinus sp.]MCB9621057.1 nitrous oxide reductase accessory protein NosL [Sandaracinus sp.]MCB9623722.1 nitrous oxide reductase accessory protein NosL [Sandaracinus sp.]MCB9630883.1 nitrous oxide reductase accessory protein NosL [Sandaracinus sp.]